MKLKLFFIQLEGPHVPCRREYLKAKSKEFVRETLYNAAKYDTSDYFGYTKIDIKEVDEVSVPELRAITISFPEEIKKLENKIVYHKKSIRAIKDTIHEKRGDYDNPYKYFWIEECTIHDNCEIYQKRRSLKIIHRHYTPNTKCTKLVEKEFRRNLKK